MCLYEFIVIEGERDGERQTRRSKFNISIKLCCNVIGSKTKLVNGWIWPTWEAFDECFAQQQQQPHGRPRVKKRSTNLTIRFLFLHTYGNIIDGCPNYLIILFDVRIEHCVCGIEMATLFSHLLISLEILHGCQFCSGFQNCTYTLTHKSETIEVKIILLQTIFDWYSPGECVCMCTYVSKINWFDITKRARDCVCVCLRQIGKRNTSMKQINLRWGKQDWNPGRKKWNWKEAKCEERQEIYSWNWIFSMIFFWILGKILKKYVFVQLFSNCVWGFQIKMNGEPS